MRCYFTGHQLFRSAVFSGQELCSSATRNSSPELSGIRARCETRPGASPKQSLCSGSKARMSELNADHLRSEETEVIDFRHGTFACFHHPESRRVTQSHGEIIPHSRFFTRTGQCSRSCSHTAIEQSIDGNVSLAKQVQGLLRIPATGSLLLSGRGIPGVCPGFFYLKTGCDCKKFFRQAGLAWHRSSPRI